MNPVINSLLDLAESNAFPDKHTSSHWAQYGKDVSVQKNGVGLLMKSSGFETVHKGSSAARALHAIERFSYRAESARYKSFPHVWRHALDLTKAQSGTPNFNVFKTACITSLLLDHFTASKISPRRFVIIGDGYGFLGLLIRKAFPDALLTCIDFPKMLIFQANNHLSLNPGLRVSLFRNTGDAKDAELTLAPVEDYSKLDFEIDCAINIASMQEMNRFSIEGYFSFLRKRSGPESRFYCLNRRRKVLPAGEVADFYDYPWSPKDEIFVDGPCPFYRYFMARSTSSNGPRIMGLRIPFVNYFDGEHMHRLVHLDPHG